MLQRLLYRTKLHAGLFRAIPRTFIKNPIDENISFDKLKQENPFKSGEIPQDFLSSQQQIEMEILSANGSREILNILERIDPSNLEENQINLILSFLATNDEPIELTPRLQQTIDRCIYLIVQNSDNDEFVFLLESLGIICEKKHVFSMINFR